MQTDSALPPFLHSYGALKDHLDAELTDLDSKTKGDTFVRFVKALIPLSEIGAQFEEAEVRQHSHDGGVDLQALSHDGLQSLFVQSRYSVRGVDDVDSILSGFHNFEVTNFRPELPKQVSLFQADTSDDFLREGSARAPHFMIVTLSSIGERILPNYEKSSKSSKGFFEKLQSEGRISILDGNAILPLLRSAYRKLHILPSNVELYFDCPLLVKDNVYVGIMSAGELRKCYEEYGDALFLENLRGFLGLSSGRKNVARDNVNAAIIDTAENTPEKFLERNNGITFRAEVVTRISESTLRLDNASIVNGCQTTMCLVHSAHPGAFLVAKVVAASDSWDIAKSANFQNRVEQIELELARFVRPQVVKGAASRLGVRVDNQPARSVFDVLDLVYQDRVTYDGVYYLFVGLFSKNPNNVLNTNYTDLRGELLEEFLGQDPGGEATFNTLFMLHKRAGAGMTSIENTYDDEDGSYRPLFQRFSKESKPDYQAFLTILAACSCVKRNIYQAPWGFSEMSSFLSAIRNILDNDPDRFIRHCRYAFEAIALTLLESEKTGNTILQEMYSEIRRSKFENLYRKVRLIADGHESHR